MTSGVLSAGEAHVSDDTNSPSSRNQSLEAEFPHFVKLTEEYLVVPDVPNLARCVAILLQRPVWRRSDDEVHTLLLKVGSPSGVSEIHVVHGRNSLNRRFNALDD